MLRRFSSLVLWSLVAAAPGIAGAQVTPAAGHTPPDDTQRVTVGAVVFGNYTYQQNPTVTDAAGNAVHKNAFDVARTYINIQGQISHIVAFRITPDVSRESGSGASLAGSLEYRMKYGFLQINTDDWMGQWNGSWMRFGIQQTPVIDYLEGIYRYRFQGTVFMERVGLLSSSDGGVSFHANIPQNMGDFHIGVYNGEGYAKSETNNEKSFQIRGTLRPFGRGSLVARGLRLAGFYDADDYIKNGPRRRASFDATFEHAKFNAGVDYVAAQDQTLATAAEVKANGWSAWITPAFKQKGNGPELLLRYDWYKPNKDLDATQQRTIAGLAYWFPHPGGSATAALLFDVDQLKATGAATNTTIGVHCLLNF